MGLEPTTPALQRRCSSQLSYVPEFPPTVALLSAGGGVLCAGSVLYRNAER